MGSAFATMSRIVSWLFSVLGVILELCSCKLSLVNSFRACFDTSRAINHAVVNAFGGNTDDLKYDSNYSSRQQLISQLNETFFQHSAEFCVYGH